jgi:hypothetical protein
VAPAACDRGTTAETIRTQNLLPKCARRRSLWEAGWQRLLDLTDTQRLIELRNAQLQGGGRGGGGDGGTDEGEGEGAEGVRGEDEGFAAALDASPLCEGLVACAAALLACTPLEVGACSSVVGRSGPRGLAGAQQGRVASHPGLACRPRGLPPAPAPYVCDAAKGPSAPPVQLARGRVRHQNRRTPRWLPSQQRHPRHC